VYYNQLIMLIAALIGFDFMLNGSFSINMSWYSPAPSGCFFGHYNNQLSLTALDQCTVCFAAPSRRQVEAAMIQQLRL